MVCEGCGNDFSPRRKENSRFCSRECAFATQRKKGNLSTNWSRKAKDGPKSKVSFADCQGCGKLFARRLTRSHCSERCRARSANKAIVGIKPVRTCRECGSDFQSAYGDKKRDFCSEPCSKRNGRRTAKLTRKARKRALPREPVDPIKVCSRDGWHCKICGCATPRSLRGSYAPNAPELDHKVPLAAGGHHTYANTQCACRACNIQKSDKLAA